MKSFVIAGLLSALMTGAASSQVYYTYPEWDRLSEQARTLYIAGAYDTLVSIASVDTAATSRHYSKCVSGRLTIEQLAKNVHAGFAKKAGASRTDQLSDRPLRRAPELARLFLRPPYRRAMRFADCALHA